MQQFGRPTQGIMPVSGKRLPQPSSRGAFVVNLGSSSTPVALSSPEHPELRKFTFFVSRRREDGRERFRLHMGYFDTQQDAEAILDIVREVYPGAWAGVAPGRKAPEGSVTAADDGAALVVAKAAAAEPAAPAVAPAPAAAHAKQASHHAKAASHAEPPAQPKSAAAKQSAHAKPSAHAKAPDQPKAPDQVKAPVHAKASHPVKPSPHAKPASQAKPAVPAAPAQVQSPPAAAAVPAPDEHAAAKQSLSSVRAAIASLEDGQASGELRALDDSQLVPTLSETQTLKLLENAGNSAPAGRSMHGADAAAAFAVQLRWTDQPIHMSELPPLAIFDAYTLYRAKVRHEGVTWHALRLGFFQDRVSADQVAGYIRSDFADATVVGVGSAERDSAQAAAAARNATVKNRSKAAKPAREAHGAKATASVNSTGLTGQFKLIEDDTPPAPASDKLEMMLTMDAGPKPAEAAPPAADRAAKPAAPARKAGKGSARSASEEKIREKLKARRPPANLEETLDVLGAGNLQLDTTKRELLDASGQRRLRHAAERKPTSRSALSRLFDKLTENIGGK